MSKATDLNRANQELPLLERGTHGWRVRTHLCPKVKPASGYYTTKEVVDLLRISNARPIHHARNKGTAYLHNPGDLKESCIVVAAGIKNKWLIYKPISA